MATHTVFVSCPTGSQGSALCRELLALGWNVHGITRDQESPSAKALQSQGVKLFSGSWDDEEALTKAMEGCDKLYLCLLPNLSNFEEAPARAQRIVRVAKAIGIKHAVVSSTLGVSLIENGEPTIPIGSFFGAHLIQKQRVEHAVTEGGFDRWTVLRPAFFMANFIEPKIQFGYTEIKDKGTWTNCMTPEVKLGLIDHEDIGRFAALVLKEPETYHGRKIGITSEELPVQEALDVVASAIGDGRSLKAIFMSDEEIAEAQAANSWIFFASEPCVRNMSGLVDMAELNKMLPNLSTLKTFLAREEAAVKQTYLQ